MKEYEDYKDYKDYGYTHSVEGIPCSIFFMLMRESPPLGMCSHNPCNPSLFMKDYEDYQDYEDYKDYKDYGCTCPVEGFPVEYFMLMRESPPLGMCSHNPCNPSLLMKDYEDYQDYEDYKDYKDYKDYGCTCPVEGFPVEYFMLMRESPSLDMCSHNPCNPRNPRNPRNPGNPHNPCLQILPHEKDNKMRKFQCTHFYSQHIRN